MVVRAVHPSRDEAAEYFFNYIDLVPPGDICDTLAQQRTETMAFLRSLPVERAAHRYAADKWSVSGVVAHLNDCERMFTFRAFWFARGFESPLPSFNQEVAARHDGADERSWDSHIEEFAAVREATLQLFSHLPADAWLRRGVASDNSFSVRALAFVTAGHIVHHNRILRERYL